MQPKRIIISLLVVILALFTAGISISAADSTTLDMAVGVSSSTALSNQPLVVKKGDTVTVSVTINANPGLNLIHFELLYDSSVLELVEGVGTGLFTGALESPVSSDGVLKFTVYHSATDHTETGILFKATFKVLKHGNAEISLDMDKGDVGNSSYDLNPISALNIAYGDDADATSLKLSAHDLSDGVYTAPSCTVHGNTSFTCSDCGEPFVVYHEGESATGHTETVLKSVAPTCSATGLTEGVVCSTCGETILQQFVIPSNPDNHVPVIDEGVAATCTSTGLGEGSHCSACGTVLTERQPIEKSAHSYGDWVVTKEATAREDGVRSKTCTVCGEILTESYPATGDSSSIVWVFVIVGVGVLFLAGGFCAYYFLVKKKKAR